MDNNKFELHPLLKDASLDKAAQLANTLAEGLDGCRRMHDPRVAADLSFMLEYLRLNFELISKD